MLRGIDPKNLKTKTNAEGPKNERKNHRKKKQRVPSRRKKRLMARLYCGNFSNAPDGPGCKGHLLFLFKAWSWDVFVSVEKGEGAWIESMKECLTIQFRKSLIWDATAGIPAARKGVMQWQRNENTKLHENTNFYENSICIYHSSIYTKRNRVYMCSSIGLEAFWIHITHTYIYVYILCLYRYVLLSMQQYARLWRNCRTHTTLNTSCSKRFSLGKPYM